MGLSDRKVKQRIPNDPRNLSWADDAARFGSNYLSKFGWDASKGLGAGGDGRLSHIKVSQKLDMMGIGAAHQKDPNGIAWKQNRDFENLLKRLNESSADHTPVESEKEDDSRIVGRKTVEDTLAPEGEKRRKKRKHKDSGEDGSERTKKRKEGKVVEVEPKTEAMVVVESSMEVVEVGEEKIVMVQVKKPAVPRHRAHRARAIAAKNISSKSAVHISEILGIAPTPFSGSRISEPQQGKLTSLDDTDGLEIEQITTSTKSVADYFKEKFASKSSGSATPSSSNSSPNADDADAYDTPRMGLGSSRARLESMVDDATQRMGLSKFSSLMSSSFLASTSFSSSVPPAAPAADKKERSNVSEDEPEVQKKENKKKKEKKKKDSVEEEVGPHEEEDRKEKKRKKGKNKVVETDERQPIEQSEKSRRKRRT